MDSDMLVLGDVHELAKLVDGTHEVYVAKHQQRFEWPSLMVFDNALCTKLTPEFIDEETSMPHKLDWAQSIGDIPPEWNFCVGYDEMAPAKLVHFTQGVPHFPEVRGCDYAADWQEEHKAMNSSCSWIELMGNSVHAESVLKRLGVM
tara:strand:- start:41 stop:481 length:441 start_codon:yes stop_codon:yes gene_type:complete